MAENARRAMLSGLVGNGIVALASGVPAAGAHSAAFARGAHRAGWYDAMDDFNAKGNGTTDDTRALQSAIDAGAAGVRPVSLPPGVYSITRPLNVPPNTMLIGSAPGLGFGCRIEPAGCAALAIGGSNESFHCCIENIMIWPRGAAPDCIISIDNSYSVTFRNIRIHEAQDDLTRAAVLMLGDAAAGGHGPCNNIIWDNLIIRNDRGQPPVAVLASKGCGSHRFIAPDLENYRVLVEWRGGQIDLVTPYTERAGRYGVNCNIDGDDETAFFNTFGGIINSARSGVGCAIRATTRNFNSFGTLWSTSSDLAAYAYSLPAHPVNFFGIDPNVSATGLSRYGGVSGWRRFVNFPQQAARTSCAVDMKVPARGQSRMEVKVRGVAAGEYWARVTPGFELGLTQLSAFVSGTDRVSIIADNASDKPFNLGGLASVEWGAL